jgi:A1 cistron-splicing factor AAR2
MFDEAGMNGSSILDYDPDLRDDFKMLLITFKSRLNEQLLAQGSELKDEQTAVGKAFEELESWLWRWGWDLRGNYVRSGKIQLEDGEMVDVELKDFEAEDERGEFAPAVVELDEDGKEKGLITF